MDTYEFNFNGQGYGLQETKGVFLNDEADPVAGIDLKGVLQLLQGHPDVSFDLGYFDQPCPICQSPKAEYYSFLEYVFYLFAKNGEYVISSISPEYQNTSYEKLLQKGKVDSSYIVSVIVCPGCEEFSVEVEQCEI